MENYSTKSISQSLLEEIAESLRHVSPYGSVEIFVQDNVVTQITVRNIRKTTTTQKIKSLPNLKDRILAQSL